MTNLDQLTSQLADLEPVYLGALAYLCKARIACFALENVLIPEAAEFFSVAICLDNPPNGNYFDNVYGFDHTCFAPHSCDRFSKNRSRFRCLSSSCCWSVT